jgi:hypothetical protein
MSDGTKRGGPATSAGKAISRLNATKHGALSEVIPQHEVAAYTQHVDLIRRHFQPGSYLEEILTERIANILWRMARVARYEQAVIKRNVDHALRRDGVTSIDELIEDLNDLAARSDGLAEDLIEDTKVYLQQTVALAALPADLVDKVPRYEAHLDRSLQRAVSQLRDLQAAAQQFVPQSSPGQEEEPGDGREHD